MRGFAQEIGGGQTAKLGQVAKLAHALLQASPVSLSTLSVELVPDAKMQAEARLNAMEEVVARWLLLSDDQVDMEIGAAKGTPAKERDRRPPTS